MKKLFCINLFLILILGTTQAQLWQRLINPMPVPPPNVTTTQKGYDIHETSDGNYVMAGVFEMGMSPNFTYAPNLIKLEAATGNILWTKNYTVFDDYYKYEVSFVEKPNGNLLLAGEDNNRIFLIETDANGDTLSTHQFVSTCEQMNGTGCGVGRVRIRATYDGNYILSAGDYGAVIVGFPSPANDIIKISPTNTVLWRKSILDDVLTDIQPTQDGGYILTGRTAQYESMLYKIDANGDSVWQQNFGSMYTSMNSIKEDSDSTFVFTADLSGFAGVTPYLIKVNKTATTTLWQRPLSSFGAAHHVIIEPNGNYVTTGHHYTNGGNPEVAFIAKVDPSGNLLHDQTFENVIDNTGNVVRATSDGNFIMVGSHASSAGGEMNKGYVVKTGYFLNTTKAIATNPTISTYPNPMEEQTVIQLDKQNYTEIQVQVVDALGRNIKTVLGTGNKVIIDRNNLSQGIYFLQINGDSQLLGTAKLQVN